MNLIFRPISEQSNLVSLKAERILGFQPNFDIEFLSMEIFNKLGELKTAGSVKSIELDQKKVHSEEFNFEVRLQGIVDSYEPAEATFRAKNTTFSELDLILPEINGISDVTENTLSLSASGPVENFRISNQKILLGKLQMVTFKLQ